MSTHELHLFILRAVQDDSGFYKNALQELAQREDLSMPVYKIIKSGALHMPTFFSYVEIEGEKFYGKAGKSKKEAELKSARAAYTVLMERKSIHSFYRLPLPLFWAPKTLVFWLISPAFMNIWLEDKFPFKNLRFITATSSLEQAYWKIRGGPSDH